MSKILIWSFRILTVMALLTVAYMSLRPSLSMGGIPHTDKVLHFLAYGVLAGLARLGWLKTWGGWIFIGMSVFGISIEIGQYMMALGRTGSLADAVANCAGAALPLLLFHFIWTRHQT